MVPLRPSSLNYDNSKYWIEHHGELRAEIRKKESEYVSERANESGRKKEWETEEKRWAKKVEDQEANNVTFQSIIS